MEYTPVDAEWVKTQSTSESLIDANANIQLGLLAARAGIGDDGIDNTAIGRVADIDGLTTVVIMTPGRTQSNDEVGVL